MADFQQLASDGHSEDDPGSSKRKRNDGTPQQRAKRNRYISIACNECKRRKIKCNGETPCVRCGNLQLECVYAPNCCSNNFRDTQEFKQMNLQIGALQEQVDSLWQNLNALRSTLGQEVPAQEAFSFQDDTARAVSAPEASMVIDPALSRPKSSPQQQRFQGPTSAGFSFDIARSSLQSMGITGPEDGLDGGAATQDGSPSGGSPRPGNTFTLHPAVRVMSTISRDEALRLCGIYEEEVGVMYPILDIGKFSQYATFVFALSEAVTKNGNPIRTGEELECDEDMDILKLVLSIALLTEGGGKSQQAKRLFNSTSQGVDIGLRGNVTVKSIQIMTLVAIYHFHSDDEGLAWRVIGVAARLCLELGLHRSETQQTLFETDEERLGGIKLFWSIYVLDRRWSFGTGMSFALQDADIDPALPKPSESSPYLTAMIAYSNISSKVWKSIASSDPSNLGSAFSKDEINYLDYQVQQWYRSIPESLQYIPLGSTEYAQYRQQHQKDPDAVNSTGGRALYRLRVLLYLRANQMRILIFRPVMHSATRILSTEYSASAHTVLELAKDTIKVLTHLNQTSDIYRAQQMCFNYFLISALAVLFLAVSHAPAQFSNLCRDEFYMALELVRGLSAQSHVSKRLWRTIRGLKEIGPKLGLFQRREPHDSGEVNGENSGHPGAGVRSPQQQDLPQQQDAHSTAAMAMAGLRAGRPVDESAFFGAHHQDGAQNGALGASGENGRLDSTYPTNPNGMANDLTSLFEAAGGFGSMMSMSMPGSKSIAENGNGSGTATSGAGGMGMAYGNEDELGRIMRDLF